MKSKIFGAVILVVVTSIGVSLAQEEFDPQPVIEGRQAALRDIGAAYKNINDEFKRSQPSLAVIRQNANQIDDLAKQQKFWFPKGTGPETEIEMKAKPAIWKQPAEFKAGQAAMAEQAAKLAKVAAGQDLAAIKAQSQALGRSCKSCHDKFREEED
jgi:cytochrome c556